jgi:hypothetical protein
MINIDSSIFSWYCYNKKENVMVKEEIKEIEEAKRKYIEAFMEWCDKHQQGKNYSISEIKKLLQLTEQNGHGVPIPKADWPREMQWGVGRWFRYSTGILDRKNDEYGRVFYCIRPEFFKPLKQALEKRRS